MWTFFFVIIFIISFFTDKTFRYIIYSIMFVGFILHDVFVKGNYFFPFLFLFLFIVLLYNVFRKDESNIDKE